MAQQLPPDVKPGVSLEQMVSSLRLVHSNQQATLTDLSSQLSSLQLELNSADNLMKAALTDQSLLSKENIWLSKEIKRMESDILDELSNELDTLVVIKNSEVFKIENLKSKQEKLLSVQHSKEKSIQSYTRNLAAHNLKSLSEDDMQKQKDSLHKSSSLVDSLEEEIKSVEVTITASSTELRSLIEEDKQLFEEAAQLRADVSKKRSHLDKSFDDQNKQLNSKISHLQTAHSAHKHQLRELNRIISSQSVM